MTMYKAVSHACLVCVWVVLETFIIFMQHKIRWQWKQIYVFVVKLSSNKIKFLIHSRQCSGILPTTIVSGRGTSRFLHIRGRENPYLAIDLSLPPVVGFLQDYVDVVSFLELQLVVLLWLVAEQSSGCGHI